MTGVKGAFACSAALVALTIAQPASALIMVSVSDGSTTINGCSVNDGGTGSVSRASPGALLLGQRGDHGPCDL